MGKRYKEELRIVKINKWTKFVHDRVKWKEETRRPELSNVEFAAPEEEEEEEEEEDGRIRGLLK